MKCALSAVALTLLPLISAHPVVEKRAQGLSQQDVDTLHLAQYLEHLEYALYSGGFNAFTEQQYEADGFPAPFRDLVNVTAEQEATHASAIGQVLTSNGQQEIPSCKYKFPYNSPKEFASLANMITSVGIGAYLGGSIPLSDNDELLTTAGSILTVEARHDAILRAGLGASPFPTAYDTALAAVFAYNLAQMFIVSCPQQLPLPILPKLKLTAPTPPLNLQPPAGAGTQLDFEWDSSTFFVKQDASAPLYIALLNQVAPPAFVEVGKAGDNKGSIKVPDGIGGVAFAVLTTFSGGLTMANLADYGTLAGPAEVVLA